MPGHRGKYQALGRGTRRWEWVLDFAVSARLVDKYYALGRGARILGKVARTWEKVKGGRPSSPPFSEGKEDVG